MYLLPYCEKTEKLVAGHVNFSRKFALFFRRKVGGGIENAFAVAAPSLKRNRETENVKKLISYS